MVYFAREKMLFENCSVHHNRRTADDIFGEQRRVINFFGNGVFLPKAFAKQGIGCIKEKRTRFCGFFKILKDYLNKCLTFLKFVVK